MDLRTAYLTRRYPAISHVFIKREVEELRRLGHEVETFTVWETGEESLLTESDASEAARTYALLPLRPVALLAAHAEALRRGPRAYVRAFAAALLDARAGVRELGRAAAHFALAVLLWDRLTRAGTRHVHVHFTGPQVHVAALAAGFGNAVAPGDEPFSWSFTVHGSVEFFDVPGERLAERAAEAAFVITVSDFARSQMLAFMEPERWDDVHVVHCGVDPETFAAPERVRDGSEPLDLLIVGRLIRSKAHRLLLRAVRVLLDRDVDVRLTVVGDGPDRDRLEALVESLDLRHRVRLVGSVGQDRIRRYYAAADVFCLPSFAEGVPVVLMEAMAMELPVVTTGVAGVGELVEHGVSGILIRPARTDMIVDALAELAADPERRRAMGAAGRERVAAQFDVRDSARRLADIHAHHRRSS